MLHHRLILSGLLKALSPLDRKGPDTMTLYKDIPESLGELLAKCSREVPMVNNPRKFDLEVVKAAFMLLSPPGKVIPEVIERLDVNTWIQHRNARDSDGDPVDPDNPYAVKWCFLGAIHRTCTVGVWHPAPTVKAIEKVLGGASLVGYNDTTGRTLKEIHGVLKKAMQ